MKKYILLLIIPFLSFGQANKTSIMVLPDEDLLRKVKVLEKYGITRDYNYYEEALATNEIRNCINEIEATILSTKQAASSREQREGIISKRYNFNIKSAVNQLRSIKNKITKNTSVIYELRNSVNVTLFFDYLITDINNSYFSISLNFRVIDSNNNLLASYNEKSPSLPNGYRKDISMIIGDMSSSAMDKVLNQVIDNK